jgi:GxxExxY protein
MTNLKHHDITEKIIGAAYKVHNNLGSGFLEKVYQNSLAIELHSLGLLVDLNVAGTLSIIYEAINNKFINENFKEIIKLMRKK